LFKPLLLMALVSVLSTPAASDQPIALRDMGSLHIGGRSIEISGEPVKEILFTSGGVPAKVDPNGTYQVEQMYAQYFLVQNRRGKLPLLMWHGGGLTGVTYETKPDGKPGWLNFFLRAGWDVYISDAVERGRSGWTKTFQGEPVFMPSADPWERFRIGPAGSWNPNPAKRTAYPGTQFPIEAYGQFIKQAVPRWVTTDRPTVAAYLELIDKVCPCALMVHSQSGAFGFKALEARPEMIKALIAVEPTLGGDPEKAASIVATPVLMIYGDHTKDHPRWSKIRESGIGYAATLKVAGGKAEVIDLPDLGLKGNSHMVMMDKNSDEVAALIQKWLISQGLAEN
jgi:pimeloyl-ACP methyl ester carboxylesterase